MRSRVRFRSPFMLVPRRIRGRLGCWKVAYTVCVCVCVSPEASLKTALTESVSVSSLLRCYPESEDLKPKTEPCRVRVCQPFQSILRPGRNPMVTGLHCFMLCFIILVWFVISWIFAVVIVRSSKEGCDLMAHLKQRVSGGCNIGRWRRKLRNIWRIIQVL